MYHVPMCLWCGKQEVGSSGGSDSFCSDNCRDASEAATFDQAAVERQDRMLIADLQAELDADAYFAQYDDDPSPYSGNYSEE